MGGDICRGVAGSCWGGCRQGDPGELGSLGAYSFLAGSLLSTPAQVLGGVPCLLDSGPPTVASACLMGSHLCCQVSISVTDVHGDDLKGAYCGSRLQRFQSMVPWPVCSAPTVPLRIIVDGLVHLEAAMKQER